MNKCQPCADVLVIAGDLCPHESPIRYNFINNRILPKWKHTIIVPGNHEFYGSTVDDEWFGTKRFEWTHENGNKCHYVNNDVVEIEGVKFVCTTLWSHVGFVQATQIQFGMSDYSEIRGNTIDKNNAHFKANKSFLRKAIEIDLPKDERCVIVTHHIPSFGLITERYRDNQLNEAFAANMDQFIMRNTHKISHWVHGHSHDFVDETIGKTRFIRNPMGYPHERDCDMDFVIEV
jgi:predicted phosphodiesterase